MKFPEHLCSACNVNAGRLLHKNYYLCDECSRMLDKETDEYMQTQYDYQMIVLTVLCVLALVAAFVLQPLVTG